MDWFDTETGQISPRERFWTGTAGAPTGDARRFSHLLSLLSDRIPGRAERTPTAPKMVTVPTMALVLTREEAAELLRVSVQHFDRHVRPHVRELSSGRLVRYPVSEIERYVNENSRRALQ